MRISTRGLELIKEFETCQLVGYLPTPHDVPTIGWGHTGPEVHVGLHWTLIQACAALSQDLERFERCVGETVQVPLTQCEFDALVSFAFNVGQKAFRDSTLLRKLNDSDYDGAAAEFKRWNKQAGAELAGLTRRRKAEYDLFETVSA